MIHCDAIILGAGIVGAACAMELAQAGMRVTVVEPGVIGGGATAAAMGHIVVMDDSPAQFALTQYSQQLWQALAPQLPAAAEYEATGTIWVAAGSEEMQEVARKQVLYSTHGLPIRVLDASELQHEEPNLRPGLAGGLLVSSDAALYPPAAANYLLQHALQSGATLIPHAATHAAEGKVQLDSSETLTAPRIINALGASAASVTPGLPIRPRKGHLVITDRAPGFARHQLVELGYIRSAGSTTADSVAFNVQPRKTGQLLIGSSRQYNATSNSIDYEILQRMLQQAHAYMPALDRLSAIRTWTGFRAATPDKLPLIGPHSADPTIYLATGHEGLGITTALATGKLLRAFLTGTQPEISIEPYLPARSFTPHQENAHA
ncbi:MAG: NAD(P)/FAD-dependent oxidoreductase [Acidobacteriaceae bacterium]